MSALGQKLTSPSSCAMSALCHKQIWSGRILYACRRPIRLPAYSSTSASIGIFGGGSIIRVLHQPKLWGAWSTPGEWQGRQRFTLEEIE